MTTVPPREDGSEVHPLISGAYSVLVTDAGAGYATFGPLALTRWRDDRTRDADGFFLYVRDLDSGTYWSVGLQPVPTRPGSYTVRRSTNAVEFSRTDDDVALVSVVCLAPEGNVELRRHAITNRGATPRRLELTSYAELALNTAAADAAHPAFSKLFVQTAYLPATQSLVAWRRPRSPGDPTLWLVHRLVTAAPEADQPDWETDRARFVGRGRSLAAPRALDTGSRLSRTTGNVLDPVVSLRRVVLLAPGETTHVTAVLGAGVDREAVESIARRFGAPAAVDAVVSCATAVPFGPAQAPPLPNGAAAPFEPARSEPTNGFGTPPSAAGTLRFDNGYGGFSPDGREYVIRLTRGPSGPRRPPVPWVNVIANERFGFLVSESGSAFTWSGNSRENRLTPWNNDPVSDPHGEALYVRDEDLGVFWSPTPGPTPADADYEVRHGWGYTRFRHTSSGLDHDVWQFVARTDPVKVVLLRVTNDSARIRRLSVFSYHELVLGSRPSVTRCDVVTERDPESGAVLAVNRARGEHSGAVAFAAAAATHQIGPTRVTCDRASFLGRYGNVESPDALSHARELDERVGVGLDPCAALQVRLEIAPGATANVIFVLGEAPSLPAARVLARCYSDGATAERALDEVRAFWQDLLGCIHVDTPSPEIDLLVNGWAAYQALSCRMWGRSAFYQPGGAFGFRDQLQDATALIYLDPTIARRQILLHAEHQFVEGDVLHWWHPPSSIGIRTHFSDDLLWLPHVTAFYVRTTGDTSVLDATARFITGPLAPDQEEVSVVAEDSGKRGSVYEHCCRAIDRSLTRGVHGLPLMGTGDWNDGMNRVGREGRGESVWLGFFLHDVLDAFVPLAERRGDLARAQRYRTYRTSLAEALDGAGWDGAWYRRAYYDDGTPLGSAESDECRIDAIAQAWAVISGVASPERRAMALDALEEHLVSEHDRLIRLLTPAFDRTAHDPGYIKGYVPGVRENGGQYTHGALWAVRALAEDGRAERAAPLLAMLSPVSAAGTPERVSVYRTEPYVIAADVYGSAPHIGRGGWTWYTGSAGWFFRVALESILGVEVLNGRTLSLRPCIPRAWPGFALRMRLDDRHTTYEVTLRRSEADEAGAWLDGDDLVLADGRVLIPLVRDGRPHSVQVTLGPHSAADRAVSGELGAAPGVAHGE